jgi:general transcription factor 3C polypeptide 2
MAEVCKKSYRYVVLWLGPFTVTKRSLSLAVTLAGLTFVALQSASLALITTPPERMAGAIGKAIAPMSLIGVPCRELLLTVLLALRFMATVFDEARNLCLGLASRGIDWSLLGSRGALALALRTGGRLFSNLLARSEAIANAMVARGFVGPQDHTLYLGSVDSSGSSRAKGLTADVVTMASLVALAWLSLRIV